ncbi:MAG: hypothetical protein IJM57_02875 [Lachnospiraceae bacterium]|nr:hypothetical protein [Lachnospiraceae bacterium]
MNRRKMIALVLNILIIVFAVTGTILVLFFRINDLTFASSGIDNFKFFTVLSNVCCGIIAVFSLIQRLRGKAQPMFAKLLAAAAVGLTFLVIAAFLGPMYGMLRMYRGSNFFFHLMVPVTAMAEFVVCPSDEEVPMRWTFFTMIPVAVYGALYLLNILINGVGVWPDTNDFYGFLNWGLPAGLGIFAGILLATWGIACALRAARARIDRK